MNRRSVMLALVCATLCRCAAHSVSVGSDEPTLSFDAGAREHPATPEDAAEPSARDAQPIEPMLDAAVSEPADAAPPPPPPDAATPPASCSGTKADCDHDPKNGCEVDLTTDPAHCGKCETACQYPDCACKAGALTTVCPQGRANCDGDGRNGCEVDTDTSMQNCGSCGRLCHTMGHDAITAVCTAGHCRITCQIEPFGQADCDDNPDNGCETNVWTSENCGQCGVKCNTCLEGVCR